MDSGICKNKMDVTGNCKLNREKRVLITEKIEDCGKEKRKGHNNGHVWSCSEDR